MSTLFGATRHARENPRRERPRREQGNRQRRARRRRHRDPLAKRALAPRTRETYAQALRGLEKWLAGRPATDETLAGHLQALYDRGLAASSATNVVAAVENLAKTKDPRCSVGSKTRATLSGYRRSATDRGRGPVDGIPWEQADRIADLAADTGTVVGLRDALLIRVMSDGMLRVAEAAAITVDDIVFKDDSAVLIVRRSKTDQEGRGRGYAGPETVRLIRNWLETAAIADGALFRRVDKGGRTGGALSARSMRDIIKRRAAAAGLDGRYSGHSLRIGSAQSLRQEGAELPELRAEGRWERTETMALYTRVQDAAAGPVARYPLRRRPAGQAR